MCVTFETAWQFVAIRHRFKPKCHFSIDFDLVCQWLRRREGKEKEEIKRNESEGVAEFFSVHLGYGEEIN